MLNNRLVNFLSSFGMMLGGVFLLFFSSVYFASGSDVSFLQFPASGKRTEAGGDISFYNFPNSRPAVPLAKNKHNFSGSITAASAIMVDAKTKTILFSKNSGEARPLASITKLMTAMVLLDLPVNWASTTVISAADVSGDHHVQVGEKFSLEDLWYVGLIGSSNTAINALVRSTGLTGEKFVDLMNAKAKELRLFSARFAEPTGLSGKNMANALDTAKLLIDALRFEKIYIAVQTGEYYAHPLNGNKPRRIWTTNWLLTNWVPNSFKAEDIAGKTGYIDDSGYNFVVSLSNAKKHAIAVVIFGAVSNEARFSEARDLAQWVFNSFLWPGDAGYENLVE